MALQEQGKEGRGRCREHVKQQDKVWWCGGGGIYFACLQEFMGNLLFECGWQAREPINAGTSFVDQAQSGFRDDFTLGI